MRKENAYSSSPVVNPAGIFLDAMRSYGLGAIVDQMVHLTSAHVCSFSSPWNWYLFCDTLLPRDETLASLSSLQVCLSFFSVFNLVSFVGKAPL